MIAELTVDETKTGATTAQAASAAVIEEVKRFERAWGDAYVRRDLDALGRIMADDYTFTDPLGGVTNKAQNLAYIDTGEFVVEDTHSRDVRVRIYGETAVVTALSNFKARYRGVAVNGNYQYTDVLVRRGGRWYAVASQATLAAGRGLLLLWCGRLLGDALHPVASLPRKIREAFAVHDTPPGAT
ncbi:MAG TPA: nuclear transport factor 2 family protein, partial [Pyrinomonadaceae bacterium]|nr:nuclear transport factor 2 family protein [Pyrinomonadaceae bacterium]